jgi:hypothetical protein
MSERRTIQIKAPIAGKAYRILLSPLVGMPHRCVPAGDAELVHFNQQVLIHELIRGSLESPSHQCGTKQGEGDDGHQGREHGVYVEHQTQVDR